MQLPIIKKGVVGLPEGEIEIDYCTYDEYWEMLMSQGSDLDVTIFEQMDFTILKFDNALGEVQVIFDAKNDYILEIYLELFEDIPLTDFLDYCHRKKLGQYGYLQEGQEVFIIFNMNFMARLNGPRDEDGILLQAEKISTLYFFSTDYIKWGATILSDKIKKVTADLNIIHH